MAKVTTKYVLLIITSQNKKEGAVASDDTRAELLRPIDREVPQGIFCT